MRCVLSARKRAGFLNYIKFAYFLEKNHNFDIMSVSDIIRKTDRSPNKAKREKAGRTYGKGHKRTVETKERTIRSI